MEKGTSFTDITGPQGPTGGAKRSGQRLAA